MSNALYDDLIRTRRNVGFAGDQGDLINQYADQSGPVAPVGNALSPMITNASMGLPQGGVQPRFQGSTVDVFGQGKGYMQPDGTIVGVNQAGQQFKVQPEGMEADRQAKIDAMLKRQMLQAQIAKEQAQTSALETKPKENAPAGYRFTASGALEAIPGGPADPSRENVNLKPIPVNANAAINTNVNSLNKLDQAIALAGGQDLQTGAGVTLKGDKSATGWKGYLPDALLTRIDPEGVDLRAMIADIGSLKLHDRSGAAITASESPRLMPFIPSLHDDNKTVVKKLRQLQQELQNETGMLSDTYSKDQGYKESPVLTKYREGKYTAQTTQPQDIPKTGEVVDGHVFLGGNPADPARWRKQ